MEFKRGNSNIQTCLSADRFQIPNVESFGIWNFLIWDFLSGIFPDGIWNFLFGI
jgi:hypothetical protein